MWLIPFAGGLASVGAVIHRSWYGERKQAGADKEAIWAEVLEGVDAQLERAIEEVRRMAREKPAALPSRPAPPVKTE